MPVLQVPREGDLRHVREAYPDARIEVLANPGERLSQQLQDGCSFRYGIVSIGGRSREEMLAVFNWCRRRLPFRFERPSSPAAVSHGARPRARTAAQRTQPGGATAASMEDVE